MQQNHLPTTNACPHAIITGGGHELWFTEWGSNQVGRVTNDRSIFEYQIQTENAEPHGIAYDKDGFVWFALQCNKIGRFKLSK